MTNGSIWPINGCHATGLLKALGQHHSMRNSVSPYRGFTLIEVMITVVIAGILAAVAIPSYLDHVRKGRRADAFDALAHVQQEQERYRSQNASYAGTLSDLGVSETSSGGHYGVALADVSKTGYTITAKPISGGKQSGDSQCMVLQIRMAKGGHDKSSRSGSGADTSRNCWPQ